MFNKITFPVFLIAVIVYILLRYANAANEHVVDFVGGFLVGMLITIIGTWIAKLFKKRKKKERASQEEE